MVYLCAMKVQFGQFVCNESAFWLILVQWKCNFAPFSCNEIVFRYISCNESAAMDFYLWSSEETSHRHAVSCDLARKHHTVMVMQVADICARTYCTFHHTSKYKNTCLLQFLLQSEIYGHVHTVLFDNFHSNYIIQPTLFIFFFIYQYHIRYILKMYFLY